jgi:hypothetical protein
VEPLWRNPELIRHVRADLRPARMATAAIVTVVVCALIILMFYHPGSEASTATDKREAALALYTVLASLQAFLLCLWCLSSCGQAISSERSLKTFDFLRTTRLTSWELLLGMLFGAPAMAYFTVACSLPFTLVIGFYAGVTPLAMVVTYAMLFLVAVVLSLVALTLSMMTERPRAGEVVLLLFLLGVPAWVAALGSSGDSRFPGLSAILVVVGLLPFYHVAPTPYSPLTRLTHVPFFGIQVQSLFVSVILYASAGAWFLLMVVRNLKKDREDIRPLSRWQAVGLTAYLNVLVFALLDFRPMYTGGTRIAPVSAEDVAAGYLSLNCVILYMVGLATLTPRGKLRAWWRNSMSSVQFYWSDDGPPWPWMAASAAAAFVLFMLEAVLASRFIPFSEWSVGALAARLFVLLAFAARDVLFLQWWVAKGFQRAVVKGVLFLLLYYVTSFTLAGFFFHRALVWLTPLGVIGDLEVAGPLSVAFGVVLQIAVSAYLLIAIRQGVAPPTAAS